MRGHWWFIRTFGFFRWLDYNTDRRRRERKYGEKFDARKHGEGLLRSIGATESEIQRAKELGLA